MNDRPSTRGIRRKEEKHIHRKMVFAAGSARTTIGGVLGWLIKLVPFCEAFKIESPHDPYGSLPRILMAESKESVWSVR